MHLQKLFLAIILVFLSVQNIVGQQRFRRDYNSIVAKAPKEPKRNGTYDGRNIFVFNYNENRDVLHITAANNQFVYVRTSKIRRDKDEDGLVYFYFDALDEKGDPILIKYFENKKYGVMLFWRKNPEDEYNVFHFINLD